MSLLTSLQTTASNMIDKYGSDVVLSKIAQTGSYDPQTGSYTNVQTDYNIKAVFKKPNQAEIERNVESEVWGTVKGEAIIAYNSLFDDLDNTWVIDGKKIVSRVLYELQNGTACIKVYYS